MEMIRQNKPLRIDGDGEQTRDLVHVEDIVEANIFCMKHNDSFSGMVLNVGSGASVSMNFIREIINKYHQVEWNWAPPRKGDVRNTLADISKLRNLGWEPKISIQEGLKRCFKKGINNEK
jgi:nucleoside-diphosphate-sugar epimerase